MINLLPPDVKDGYRYARRNVGMRRWVLMFLAALVGLGAITTYGSLTLHQSTNSYNSQIAVSQQEFKKEDFDGTQKQIQNISGSFKLVVKVLGQEVLFSDLIQQIAQSIPANANLTGLNISQSASAIDITAVATDYSTATQVQVNLSPPNPIFSKVDIVSIACDSTGAANSNYPCTVNLRALFSANNPFLFINSKAIK